MKMKELSAKVNIPETTIRYYINDGIFIPESYTENYEGRKNYNFTENDIERLNQIAILRKYGFTMKSIKELSNRETDIVSALKERIDEERQSIKTQNENIEKMEEALQIQPSCLKELCDILNSPIIKETPIPVIDEQSAYEPMYEHSEKIRKIITRVLYIVLILFCLGIIIACISSLGKTGNTSECNVIKVDSKLYTQEQIDSAIETVMSEFKKNHRNCKMLEIGYGGDLITQEKNAHYAQYYDGRNRIVIFSRYYIRKPSNPIEAFFVDNPYAGETISWGWELTLENGKWDITGEGTDV